mmetsp:Transcript_5044/g.7355  ORF Transcript_5044/g.7355 Transcript_5044/m.7355 type:complete len:431 (-) Transcript_5044:705-1997(-)
MTSSSSTTIHPLYQKLVLDKKNAAFTSSSSSSPKRSPRRNNAVSTSSSQPWGEGPITCHAWYHPSCQDEPSSMTVHPSSSSSKCVFLALSASHPADPTSILICSISATNHKSASWEWELLHTLAGVHEGRILSLDWSCTSLKDTSSSSSVPGTQGQIVSCSKDRQALIWTYNPSINIWKPIQVLLKSSYTPLQCCFLSGTSGIIALAHGGSDKILSLGKYEQDHDVYSCRTIGRRYHTSSVLCTSFHPSGLWIMSGGCDGSCRVFSLEGFRNGEEEEEVIVAEARAKGIFLPFSLGKGFGKLCSEYKSSSGWITCTAWSPSGNTLAFASQDSTIHVIRYFHSSTTTKVVEEKRISIRLDGLPLRSILFSSENEMVGGGYDGSIPILIRKNQNEDDDEWIVVRGQLKQCQNGGSTESVKKRRNCGSCIGCL